MVPEGPPGGLSHEIAFSGGRNEILMSHSECHLIGGDIGAPTEAPKEAL